MTVPARLVTSVTIVIAGACLPGRAEGQAPAPLTAADADAAARREILQSDRWRRVQRDFDNWLATQRLYSAAEVAAIRAELAGRTERMSARELQNFLEDMEDRLQVLTSPAAEEARVWVSQYLATARNAEEQLRARRPDVMNMSAAEIRAELDRFQRQRASRQQVHSASAQVRAAQVQSAQATQAARQQAVSQAQDARSRAAAESQQRIQAPPPSQRTNTSQPAPLERGSPYFYVSPWGTPVRWNPMLGQW